MHYVDVNKDAAKHIGIYIWTTMSWNYRYKHLFGLLNIASQAILVAGGVLDMYMYVTYCLIFSNVITRGRHKLP